MARQNLEGNFGKLLEDVTREGLGRASTEALAELAKQLWYGQGDLVPVLEEEVSGAFAMSTRNSERCTWSIGCAASPVCRETRPRC